MLYLKLKMAMNRLVTEKRGDTNFISILVILGIVLLLAVAFIGFKDQIFTMVQEAVDKFLKVKL